MVNRVPVLLVVDDDEGIRTLLALCLGSGGYKVLLARNGREALEIWKRQRRKIDLVITDIEMPEMSGIEFANQLNQWQTDIPILFVSGSPQSESMENTVGGRGPLPFLAKPFDLRVLRQMVEQLLHPASSGASAIS